MSRNKSLIKHISLVNDIPKVGRDALLKITLMILKSPDANYSEELQKLSSNLEIDSTIVINVLGVYMELIKLFIISSNKEFNEKLTAIGVPQFLNDEIMALEANGVTEEVLFQQIEYTKDLLALHWKIDISRYESKTSSNPTKTVMIVIELQNGKKYTLELNRKGFDLLRYNVALALKEINLLEINH